MDSIVSTIQSDQSKADRIHSGLERARARGKKIGRPHVDVSGRVVIELRGAGLSWTQIARRVGAGTGTVRRAFQHAITFAAPCQNPPAGIV